MKSLIRCSLFSCALLLPATVCAQDPEPPRQHPIDKAFDICTDKNPSTGGMVNCADVAYKKWDRELNKNYQALMKQLKPAGKQLLKSGQLSWIKYRDNEFKLIDIIYDEIQGTMYIPFRIVEKMQIVKYRAIGLSNRLNSLADIGP